MKKNILSIGILTLTLLILYSFLIYLPLIEFKVKHSKDFKDNDISLFKYNSKSKEIINDSLGLFNQLKKEKNYLIIPKINVHSEILEGSTIDILNQLEGVWREPLSSTPKEIKNIVIVGHRWQFLPPNTNTFFLLPELKLEDFIIIFWQGVQFNFKVFDIYEVDPNSKKPYLINNIPTLTLYTCTPVFIANKRFVIKAQLIV